MKLSEYTSSTAIYLEQMQNYIDLGEGYNGLRKLLFRELHQLDGNHNVADDKLADAIITTLTQTLNNQVNFHQSDKIFRTLQIIEDLITYTEEVITPIMHNELFISALVNVAVPKLVTFNSQIESQNRTRTLGIFLFWFDKYAREEDCRFELFIEAYKHLRDKKLQFPSMITIKPNDYFKNEANQSKSSEIKTVPQVNSNSIILTDIEQFTIKTQQIQRENIKVIVTTEYVRLIKHKSKVLYDFTTKPNEFNPQQKNTVKDLYKRLRTVLKEIDKYNESNIQTKKMKEQEQNYVEQKNTPTKGSPAAKQQNSSGKKQSSQPQQTTLDLLESNTVVTTPPIKTKLPNSPSTFDDLLDMGLLVNPPSPIKVQKKINSPIKNIPTTTDLLSTPIVQSKVEDDEQFVDGILVDTTPVPAHSPSIQKMQTDQLYSIFQNPRTPSKAEKQDEENKLLVKLPSNKSLDSQQHSFQNQKNIKNPYNYIPDNLNLTPNSSVNDEDDDNRVKQDLGFNLFGLKKIDYENVKDIYVSEDKYDDLPKKLQKTQSLGTPKKEKSSNEIPILIEVPHTQTTPITRKVEPVDYSKYAVQKSPGSFKSESDEQHHFGLKSSPFQKQHGQSSQLSPCQDNKLKQNQ